EIPTEPAADGDRRRREGEELRTPRTPERPDHAGRGRAVHQTVERRRRVRLVLAGNGEPVPPAEEHRRNDRRQREALRGVIREAGLARGPSARRDGGGERQREQGDSSDRDDRVQRMPAHDRVAELHDQPAMTATRRPSHGSNPRSTRAPAPPPACTTRALDAGRAAPPVAPGQTRATGADGLRAPPAADERDAGRRRRGGAPGASPGPGGRGGAGGGGAGGRAGRAAGGGGRPGGGRRGRPAPLVEIGPQ